MPGNCSLHAHGSDHDHENYIETIIGALGHARGRLALWWRRWRGRRELASLGDRFAADMGVRRLDLLREAGKPFWQP